MISQKKSIAFHYNTVHLQQSQGLRDSLYRTILNKK